jgi:hypothetical protein
MSKETRRALAKLSFTEKIKILEQLREMSREVAAFGLRKKPPGTQHKGSDPLLER